MRLGLGVSRARAEGEERRVDWEEAQRERGGGATCPTAVKVVPQRGRGAALACCDSSSSARRRHWHTWHVKKRKGVNEGGFRVFEVKYRCRARQSSGRDTRRIATIGQ